MKGYWQKPEETHRSLQTMDGLKRAMSRQWIPIWLFLKSSIAKKDMILVSGFNVYPNEVEDQIATHPGVLEVAAVRPR